MLKKIIQIDILLTHDTIFEIVCDQDKEKFKYITANYKNFCEPESFTFFSNFFVSKIKRKDIPASEFKLFKVTGHYDSKTNMFLAKCFPILSPFNKDKLVSNDFKCFSTANNLNLGFKEFNFNTTSLIGYDLRDLAGHSLFFCLIRFQQM